ncbi:MAG: DUF6522 family protein [Rhodomicrobium sp.]
MLKVEIQGDDTFQIDASIVVRDLGLEPFEVQRLMHEGKLTRDASVALMKMRGDIV